MKYCSGHCMGNESGCRDKVQDKICTYMYHAVDLLFRFRFGPDSTAPRSLRGLFHRRICVGMLPRAENRNGLHVRWIADINPGIRLKIDGFVKSRNPRFTPQHIAFKCINGHNMMLSKYSIPTFYETIGKDYHEEDRFSYVHCTLFMMAREGSPCPKPRLKY